MSVIKRASVPTSSAIKRDSVPTPSPAYALDFAAAVLAFSEAFASFSETAQLTMEAINLLPQVKRLSRPFDPRWADEPLHDLTAAARAIDGLKRTRAQILAAENAALAVFDTIRTQPRRAGKASGAARRGQSRRMLATVTRAMREGHTTVRSVEQYLRTRSVTQSNGQPYSPGTIANAITKVKVGKKTLM